MSSFYDELCNMLIRPARQTYTDYDLGSPALGSLALRQNFTFMSSQNHQIKASFYRQRNPVTSACVVYLHSFNGSRLQPLRFIPQVIKKGFHFCSMDFAGCGNSGGEYVSLGYHQRWDAFKLLQQLRERWGIRQVIIWGRSMGAVTAIKLYSLLNEQQNQNRSSQIKILSLILDSAFISLKRMVIEVGSSHIKIPQLLIKAIFLLVGSSIEQRANFKLQQLELAQDVQKIRCPVMLLASKEDTFVNFNHSEEIFAKLPLHDHKQIEYINGEHYQQRSQAIFSAILKFMEQKFKLFSELTPRQLRISYCIRQEGSIQKPSRSLRRYQPRKEPEIAQEQQIQRPCSGEKAQPIKLSELHCQEMHTPVSENKITSDRLITLGADQTRQYQTEKKIEGPHIKITFGAKPIITRDCLRSKSKPNFSGKILEIVSKSKGLENQVKMQNNENTDDCEYENHCNIISDKLKKRGRAHKDPQVHFLINRELPNANEIRFESGTQNAHYTSVNVEGSKKPQKLSMTAQQYKNVQINLLKGVVHLSPTGKKKVKTRFQQSKSMSNLKMNQPNGNVSNLKSSSRLNLVKAGQGQTQRIE